MTFMQNSKTSKQKDKFKSHHFMETPLVSDNEGHYDVDGVSYRNGHVYVGSYWPEREKTSRSTSRPYESNSTQR